LDQKKLDQQSQHWEASFSNKPEMFGLSPSIAAVKALEKFKEENFCKNFFKIFLKYFIKRCFNHEVYLS